MIFEKLFSKENKKDEIVDVKLTDKEFNKLKIKLGVGDVIIEQGENFSVSFKGKNITCLFFNYLMESCSLSRRLACLKQEKLS